MSGLFGKFRDFVGLPGSEEYDEYYDDEVLVDGEYEEEYDSPLPPTMEQESPKYKAPEPDTTTTGKSGNVVGMPGASRFWSGSASEVLVMEPKSFEEMPRVIQSLRDRKSVVLNLTMMDAAQAQRAVDFVAGATFTIDGHQERVGESIFLFTPNCVQVRTQAVPPQDVSAPSSPVSSATSAPWQNNPLDQIAQ